MHSIVEGDLFLSARSSFFLSFFFSFFLSFFFPHPASYLKIKIFVVKNDVFGEAWEGRERETEKKEKHEKMKRNEKIKMKSERKMKKK